MISRLLLWIMSLFPISQNLYIIVLLVCFAAVLIAAGVTVFYHIKARIKHEKISARLKYNTVAVVCIVLCAVYTSLNFGWVRYLLSVFITLHSALLVVATDQASGYVHESAVLKRIVVLNYIFYVCAHLIMPDTLMNTLSGFLGLVEYGEVSGNIVAGAAEILFIVSTVLLIIQITAARRMNKNGTEQLLS